MSILTSLCLIAFSVAALSDSSIASVCSAIGGISNGCSVGVFGEIIDPDYPDRVFKSACDRHDICYRCSKFMEKTRYECDARFLENMSGSCAEDDAECGFWAGVFYGAVRFGGGSKFYTAQRVARGTTSNRLNCQALALSMTCW